ncbi:NADH-quinone oxidoreductase subunit G [Rhodococcoides fascians]|uniref:NADH-quinone oxidoreductase subunit G n=1 Tax=Rhodococcoides fascians TaxID=1828 RepID=UPI0005641CE4|nr:MULTISPECIES: NADH-quinone oxidoreductase subunit G [Rhodococcus]OZE94680.1 NADH-quinone oxidoreductase subunit G [Rhodococcus sp. 15-1189-1-1a]OZF08991.1 NADH-quinone oxidoreductase subunit G [Rhodococcus sp. 14-2686-1-2]
MSTSVDTVTVSIDGQEIQVLPGTLVIRAAELIGIQIPRFCDHPLLDPVGACRQCLVEVEGQRKPLASCTTTVTDGMVVRTQLSSPVAAKAQKGVMELLLINHPLDCPVCDKGGECPLQNQAMSTGRSESRFVEEKRTYPKPIPLSTEVLLDRERCVLCARCTRFSSQIAGDPFIELVERGALQQVGIYENEPFESYFSGNTVQVCPVGALTGAAYRFRARPYDLVSTPSACEHCASGCAQRTDHRRGKVLRRLAGDDPTVNEEWNCDKGRWAFTYATEPDRLTTPLVRTADGTLEPASWSEAMAVAAAGLNKADRVGVLVGGRATVEDAYAYSKFTRVTLRTNDIDFRARAHSVEEAEFLASHVAGTDMNVTYARLDNAPSVVLVGFEPEEESPIVFLRLRKAVRTKGQKVRAVAPFLSAGTSKLGASLISCVPGQEPAALAGVGDLPEGSVILVGERIADTPGGYTAVVAASRETGAALVWIPRRAGDRGALDMGALPTLLPGGRPVGDTGARTDLAEFWGTDALPESDGLDTTGILGSASSGGALVVGGVELADLPDPAGAAEALKSASFVVSLEIRHSSVTEHADVVFPVAPVTEKAGTYLDWEGRSRSFDAAIPSSRSLTDGRVLHALAAEMNTPIGLPDVQSTRSEIDRLGSWTGAPPPAPSHAASSAPRPSIGQAVLATWRMLLDAGRMQDGEPHLAGTARTPVVRLSPGTAAEIGVSDGDPVTVSSDSGSITLELAITDLPDRVVWLPMRSTGSEVNSALGVGNGAVVRIEGVSS